MHRGQTTRTRKDAQELPTSSSERSEASRRSSSEMHATSSECLFVSVDIYCVFLSLLAVCYIRVYKFPCYATSSELHGSLAARLPGGLVAARLPGCLPVEKSEARSCKWSVGLVPASTNWPGGGVSSWDFTPLERWGLDRVEPLDFQIP